MLNQLLEAPVEQEARVRMTGEQTFVEAALSPVQAHYRQVMEQSAPGQYAQ
jgi:hypothetical protein